MIPIAISSKEQFDEHSFIEYILKTCKQHKEKNRAIAFAFIVYDFKDATIKKVLDDTDYINSLHDISGQYLSVFYIDTKDKAKKQLHEMYKKQMAERERFRASHPGMMEMMVAMPTGKIFLNDAAIIFKEKLGLEESLKTPFILFFQTNGEDVTDHFIVSLKQDKIEEAFNELRRQIENAVDSLKDIKVKNYDPKIIFDNIKKSVRGGKQIHYVKTKIIEPIKTTVIITSLKLLFGIK